MKTKWLEKTKIVLKDHQILIALLVLSGLTALIVEVQSLKPTTGTRREESPATHIPDGFVLVPIEIQNPEALDSILGNYGVVDLFAPHADGTKRIARRIKILRAPLNPSHFAVLAPEDEAPLIVREPGPITVAVQNPKSAGTDFVKPIRKRTRLHVENLE